MKGLLKNSALMALVDYIVVLVNAGCSGPKLKNHFFRMDDFCAKHFEFTFQGDTNFRYAQINKNSFQKYEKICSVYLSTIFH